MGFSASCGLGFVLGLLGVIALILGMIFPPAIDKLLANGIKDAVVLKEEDMTDNTDKFKSFQINNAEGDTPVYVTAYMWNITNPYAVLAPGTPAAPILAELGPYVYRKYTEKVNIGFELSEDGQKVVKYRNHVWYEFQADKSVGTEDDKIVTVNMLYQGYKAGMMGSSQTQAYLALIFMQIYNAIGKGASFYRAFTVQPVKNMLFGYTDAIATQAKPVLAGALASSAACSSSSSPQTCGTVAANTMFPSQVVPGILLKNNGAKDFTWAEYDYFYTGENNLGYCHRMYKTYDAQYIPSTAAAFGPYAWASPAASRVQGYDGTQVTPGVDKDMVFPVWVDQTRRFFQIYNKDEAKVTIQGIELMKFQMMPTEMHNCATNSFNCGYFISKTGMLNMTSLNKGVPIFLTKPHFLGVDSSITLPTGMSPAEADKHDLWVGIEPISGATMAVHKRLQVNVLMSTATVASNPDMSIQTQYMPTLWIEEAAEINDYKAAKFKNKVYFAKNLSKTLFVAFFIGGIIASALGLLLLTSAAMSGGSNVVQVAPAK